MRVLNPVKLWGLYTSLLNLILKYIGESPRKIDISYCIMRYIIALKSFSQISTNNISQKIYDYITKNIKYFSGHSKILLTRQKAFSLKDFMYYKVIHYILCNKIKVTHKIKVKFLPSTFSLAIPGPWP